jgi:hypothetical protein
VLLSVVGPRKVRLVTHLDLDDAGAKHAADVVARLLGGSGRNRAGVAKTTRTRPRSGGLQCACVPSPSPSPPWRSPWSPPAAPGAGPRRPRRQGRLQDVQRPDHRRHLRT